MPLHPKLVHLPIALAVLMPLISGGLLIAWWRGALQRRTWIIAIALQVLLVGSGLLALRTGEGDEERVERAVPEAVIEAHEEAAEAFVITAGVVLVIALGAALIRRERAARIVAACAALGTLGVLGAGYRTGQAGGELVYRHGAASAWTSPATQLPGPPAEPAREQDSNDLADRRAP